ncbi:ABC transporter ATP-binding protein [Terricaulis silvestris]|uniref:Teichoic acids export ATP-binding protein TagH n=1 Tax=Terricaulis silvestris TaxID=2686094 RepID=A0A6I6MM61_9CAUL|nr:ATP-binding cassette domain-containing protein [Terricaulis silvestris]QGZ96555.1 Teichoic acids export ATP-binding protein TagH [Terricaulis silvestris]
MVHVTAHNISFRYPVFAMTGRSLKASLFRQLSGGTISADSGVVNVQALRDVSFDLKPNDRLGLIGRNGSGKSTLLRLAAGLAFAQEGLLSIEGRVVPLIEKGLGVNPELSGAANIELPLRLLGATTEEVNAAKRDIPEFTGLGAFIDLPVRTYSEGMKTRLSFAICTAIRADVLVLDEWLGAGDIEFQERAETRLASMMQNTRIVVLATHSLDLVNSVCTKVLWLDRGAVAGYGTPAEIVPKFFAEMHNHAAVANDAKLMSLRGGVAQT